MLIFTHINIYLYAFIHIYSHISRVLTYAYIKYIRMHLKMHAYIHAAFAAYIYVCEHMHM